MRTAKFVRFGLIGINVAHGTDISSSIGPNDGVVGCILPPGFPIEDVYHPLINPNSTAIFSDLTGQWYERATEGLKHANIEERGTYDIFGQAAPGQFQSRPWPRNTPRAGGGSTVTVFYCFFDQATKTRIQPALQQAINLFKNAMGGAPSASTAYGVQFSEFTRNGQSQFCWAPRIGGPLHGWNQNIPYEVLWIESINGPPQQYAPTGFRSYNPPQPWMNKLRIDVPNSYIILHELMHVLGMRLLCFTPSLNTRLGKLTLTFTGMLHEHQRPDRDNYMHVNFRNIAGYHEALQRYLLSNRKPRTSYNVPSYSLMITYSRRQRRRVHKQLPAHGKRTICRHRLRQRSHFPRRSAVLTGSARSRPYHDVPEPHVCRPGVWSGCDAP